MRILQWLADQTIASLQAVPEAERGARFAAGIAWRPGAVTASRRVALSKSLARLERWGLVERIRPGGRTAAVRLAGWDQTQRLTAALPAPANPLAGRGREATEGRPP